ncbi:hypothetical protein EV356DRAFT_512838 [Viridothelium virens]|uniref:LisH domain-containing protein n=1 Tax=Viridothelium virens TaxID=1048519 RepID=A0A6A6HGP5_VIRVR|nr:hypothetical protein EV356DRAFT_512838 [Viridothelium virens]
MSAADLESDHLNYLIWRYLQESGPRFRKAADQLRRDWEINPEDLPFATSVQTGDLVRLVLDGLHHDEIATTAMRAQMRASEGGARRLDASRTERKYKFISQPGNRELAIRTAPYLPRPSEDRERCESPLKRQRDGVNGASADGMGRPPAPKRVRKSTAAELRERENITTANGVLHTDEEASTRPDEDESMIEDGPLQPVSTLENGTSNAAQTESNGFAQPEELTAEEHEITASDSVIMHASWSRSNTEELLFVGDEHTANLWHFPSKDGVHEVDAIRLDMPSNGPHNITSHLWDYRGSELLLSHDHSNSTGPFGLVSFNRDTSRVELENLDQNSSTCLSLRQNPVTHMVIAFSVSAGDQSDPSESGCTQIWQEDFLTNNSPIGITNHARIIYDGDWIDHTRFVVSCGSNVELYQCIPNTWERDEEPSVSDMRSASALDLKLASSALLDISYAWDIVRHVPGTTKIISVSTESSAVAWADAKTLETSSLAWNVEENGLILGMDMQSERTLTGQNQGASQQSNGAIQPAEAIEARCFFAVLTDLGKIFIYDAFSFATPSKGKSGWKPREFHHYDIGPIPALSVAFSNNNRFFAIGSLEKVFIYDLNRNSGGGGQPAAIWTGEPSVWANGLARNVNGVDSRDTDEELTEHCLSWNENDTKLVYALNNRHLIATDVIN